MNTGDDDGSAAAGAGEPPVIGDDPRQPYVDLLMEIFNRAFQRTPFGTLCTLLRVGGMTDSKWDPFDEAAAAFDDYNWILAQVQEHRDDRCARRVGLLMYCQAVEMSGAQEILGNLLRCATGQPYVIDPFSDLGRRKKKGLFSYIPASATQKYRRLRDLAATAGIPELSGVIDLLFNDKVRNAFSHSDYILTDEYFRYSAGGRWTQIPVDELDGLIATCFNFFGAFMALHRYWLTQLAELPRYHKWPNYEILEVLASENEGVYGFQVHFSNGGRARFTRRAGGTEAMNLSFERDGTIGLNVGIIDDLEPIWKIDGKPVHDWEGIKT